MQRKPCAANGAATTPVRTTEHMERCSECKRAVRFDLVDHYFFGFAANCEYATIPREGREHA